MNFQNLPGNCHGIPTWTLNANSIIHLLGHFTLSEYEVRTKVRSLLEHNCTIISFKIVVIFNITSAVFVLMLADVVLKMTTILKEMRIAQLGSKSERALVE